MKKLFTIGAFILGSTMMVEAQYFTFDKKTYSVTTPGQTPFIEMKNYVKNASTADTLTFRWKLLDVGPLPTGWSYSGFCDNVTCYGATNNWTTGAVKSSLPIAAAGKSDFKLQIFVPTTGQNTTKVLRFKVEARTQVDTAYFIITKNPLSINAIAVEDTRVNIYPNPSVDNINLFVNKELKATTALFYNVTGQLVKSLNIADQEAQNVDISDLSNGMYSIQIIGNEGVLTSRKFIKK